MGVHQESNLGIYKFLYAKNTGLDKFEKPQDKNLYTSGDNIAKNGYGYSFDPSSTYFQNQPSILDGVYNANLSEVNN